MLLDKWGAVQNIGNSKKPLKKGGTLKKRTMLDIESIKIKRNLFCHLLDMKKNNILQPS
jgi:hypothetical protein